MEGKAGAAPLFPATTALQDSTNAVALPLRADELPVGRCEECGDEEMHLDRVLLEHFQLHVCLSCKQDASLRTNNGSGSGNDFELLSKTRAKAEYALPDSFFRGLPRLSKPNPRHEAFAPLQLFLRRTLAQEAYRLYGSAEGLEHEKQARRKRAFRSATSRTKHLLKRKHLESLGTEATSESDGKPRSNADTSADTPTDSVKKKQKQKQKQKRKAYVPVAASDHRHEFVTERYDEAAASWTKQCVCGMQVLFEKW